MSTATSAFFRASDSASSGGDEHEVSLLQAGSRRGFSDAVHLSQEAANICSKRSPGTDVNRTLALQRASFLRCEHGSRLSVFPDQTIELTSELRRPWHPTAFTFIPASLDPHLPFPVIESRRIGSAFVTV